MSRLDRELPGNGYLLGFAISHNSQDFSFEFFNRRMRRLRQRRVSAENSISIMLSQLADLGVK